MGFWFTLFLWTASFALSDYLRERLPAQTPSGVGDFNIPTATEGRYKPVIPGGKIQVRAPNCIWYGDFAAQERTVTTGVIFRRDETIGFTYQLALQYALFQGECFGITRVWIGDDEVFSGAATDVIDIDRPDLFGGEKQGGGFVGRLRLFNGSDTQGVSTFLDSRLDPLPAYRGLSYIMVTNVAESAGANIGESNRLRYIRVEVQAFSTLAQGGLGNRLGLTGDMHIIGENANPVALAYELYLNSRWGRAFPSSDVNLNDFRAKAETVFNEGIGYSEIITEQTTTGDVQNNIEQHIDGYIGPNPITGQIEVTLARPDYTPADEYQADAGTIMNIRKWDKGDWSQTFNQTRLQYTDRAKTYKDTYAIAQASGNRIIQGKTVTKEIGYPGVHDSDVANIIAHREMRGFARPLHTGTIELDRSAYALRPASIVVVTSPKIGVTDLAVRVSSVRVGETRRNSIEVEVVEDVFDNEVVSFVNPPPSDFVPPVQGVVAFAAADQAAFEAPFVLMRYDESPNAIPKVATLARRTGGIPTQYEIIRRTRAVFGMGTFGSFESSGFVQAGFCTVGELRNAESAWQSGNGSLTMQIDGIGAESLDALIGDYSPGESNASGIAVINPGAATEEWVAFTSIVDDLAGIRLEGLYRGAMDTAMASHTAAERIWFIWTGGLGLTDETFSDGSGVDVKLLPRSPSDAIIESEAIAIGEREILDPPRNARPLLPRRLDINGTEFPSVEQSADFVAQATPTLINGLLFDVYARAYNTEDIIWQVQGLNSDGNGLVDAEWAGYSARIEWWLYDLDTTPSPTRGDAIITNSFDWTTSEQGFIISRDDLTNAGISDDFSARIEIETEHSPAGQPAAQKSRQPMFFDFDITGTFGVIFDFANVVFLSHFDGTDAATTADDESDNDATLTFEGNAQIDTAQSRFGGACLLVDGTGDYVTAPDIADYNLPADFTIECWVRFNGAPGGAIDGIVLKWDPAGNQRSWMLAHNNGDLELFYTTNGSTQQSVSRTWNPVADTWYHIAVTRDGDTLRFFVNGLQLGADATVSDVFFDSTTVLRIGGNSGGNQYFNGWIDEVRIISGEARYVTDFGPVQGQVSFLSHFDGTDGATTADDESLFGHTLTFTGNAQIDTDQSQFGGACLLLDGSGDYVSTPSHAAFDFGTDDFTVEFWMRRSDDPTHNIISWSSGGVQAAIYMNNNQTTLRFQHGGSDRITGGPVNLDTWYHVALVRIDGDFELFLDGVSLGTSSAAATFVQAAFEIGRRNGSSNTFEGWIDEVRVLKGIGLYAAPFTVPTAAFPDDLDDEFFFHRVALLAGFNGSDGATTFDSEDRYSQSATFVGNAELDSAQSQFGITSLLLDGAGDYVTFPDATQFDFADEDFTIECWVRFNGDPGTTDNTFIAKYLNAGQGSWFFGLRNNDLEFSYTTNGSTINQILRSFNPVGDQWYHFAVTRDGSDIRLFADGVLQGSADTGIGSSSIFTSTTDVTVGAFLFPGVIDEMNGWIDELRVITGRAEYTEDFTPPSSQFPRF